MEHRRLHPPKAKTIRQAVRGEDVTRRRLGLLRHLRKDRGIAMQLTVLPRFAAVSLEAIDHLVEADLLWPARQSVTAMRPPGGGDHARPAQGHQDLIEEWPGDPLTPGNLGALQRPATSVRRQLEDGANPVFRLHRKPHPQFSYLDS